MARPLVSDALWERIEPLLPPKKPRRHRYPGRKPLDDRQCLTGILFVLKTGLPWEMLPQEMGCGSGMTCWRRLQFWHQRGVWERVKEVLLQELKDAEEFYWSKADMDPGEAQEAEAGQRKGREAVERTRACAESDEPSEVWEAAVDHLQDEQCQPVGERSG